MGVRSSIVVFDPGPRTGWVRVSFTNGAELDEFDYGIWEIGNVPTIQAIQQIEDTVIRSRTLVYENFRIQYDKAQKIAWQEPVAYGVIWLVRSIHLRWWGEGHAISQEPAQRKVGAQESELFVQLGLPSRIPNQAKTGKPDGDHIRDAARHLLIYLHRTEHPWYSAKLKEIMDAT